MIHSFSLWHDEASSQTENVAKHFAHIRDNAIKITFEKLISVCLREFIYRLSKPHNRSVSNPTNGSQLPSNSTDGRRKYSEWLWFMADRTFYSYFMHIKTPLKNRCNHFDALLFSPFCGWRARKSPSCLSAEWRSRLAENIVVFIK